MNEIKKKAMEERIADIEREIRQKELQRERERSLVEKAHREQLQIEIDQANRNLNLK